MQGNTDALLAATARGAGWVIGWRLATRVLGLISTLTLVRLLAPRDFGLVALATSFAQAADALSLLGVQDALIRERTPRRELYDTGFTLNAIRSLVTAALIAVAAGPASRFFHEPRLAAVLLALAFATLVSGCENIGIIDFRRDFKFDKEFRLLVLPRMTGICITIATAFVLRDYRALIAGILCTRTLRISFGYAMHPYRPRLTLSAWRELIGFSLWTWAVSIVVLVRDRSDSFVIGRALDPAQVGIYALGAEIAALPTTELVEPLGRACFSGFTAARHSGVSAAETYLSVISTTSLLTLPAGIGLSLVAAPLVQLAFGPEWAGAVPVVRALGIAAICTVFGQISSILFSAHALLGSLFRITLGATAVRAALLVSLAVTHGLPGAAVGAALATMFEQTLLVHATLRRFHIGGRALLRCTWRGAAAAAAMAAVLGVQGIGWDAADGGSPGLALLGEAAAGAAVYMTVLAALWVAAGRPRGAETRLFGLLTAPLARVLPLPKAAAASAGNGE